MVTRTLCLLGLAVMSGFGDGWTPADLPPTPGRNLFVAADGPAASDQNDGSWERPCKTITKAADLAQPGDTVWVRGGVYREVAQVYKSGEGPGRMITFRAMPGEQPVVKGSEVLSGWTRCADEPNRAIWEADWPWPGVYPTMICADDVPLIPFSVPPETEDLKPPKQYCQFFLGFGRGRDKMTPGSFWYDEARKKLLVWLKGDEDPNGHLVEAALRACCWDSRGSFIRVEGLRFRQSALVVPLGGVAFVMTGPGGGGSPAEGCLVRNCEASLSAFEGMVVRGGKRVTTVVEDCWVHHNGNGCGSFEGQGDPDTDSWMLVRRCRLTDNNWFNWNPSWHCGGKHFGNRVLFDRCEFLRAYNAPGCWFDCHTRDCIVNRCYATQNGQFGPYYEIGETGAFLNNVVEGNPHCCAIALMGSSRSLVANNMVSATERGIIVGGEGMAEGKPSRVTCHNAVLNNIVIGRSYPLITVSPDSDLTRGNTSDHNLLWQTKPASWQKPGDGGYYESGLGAGPSMDLATWQARRQQDGHSRVMDPRVEAEKGRFRRLPGSPAWSGGKGLTLADVRELFALRPMPEVGVDSGAASIRDHKPASEAFLRKVVELLATPARKPMPVGPLPDPLAGTARPVSLTNADFEQPKLGGNATSSAAIPGGPVPGWTIEGGPAHAWHANGTGVWNWYPPSGDNVLVIPASPDAEVTVAQTASAPLQPGRRYRLTAWFGQRVDQASLPWPRVTLSLFGGPRLLGTVEVPEPTIRPAFGVWVESVLVVEPWEGQLPPGALRAVIRRAGAGKVDVCVDDVTLIAEGE